MTCDFVAIAAPGREQGVGAALTECLRNALPPAWQIARPSESRIAYATRARETLAALEAALKQLELVILSADGADRSTVAPEEALFTAFRAGRTNDLSSIEIRGPVCVADPDSGRAWVLADPFGRRALYYGSTKQGIAFATQIEPLLSLQRGAWSLDPRAVVDLFTFEHTIGTRTLARSIRLVPGGCLLNISHRGVRLARYAAEIREPLDDQLGPAEFAERLYEGLDQAVSRIARERKSLAVTLSGGLDSRAILGVAVRHAAVRAYTFGSRESAEVRYARRLAERVGVEHRIVEMDPSFLPRWLDRAVALTGGMVGAIHFHILTLADALGSESVVLDGMGGDALTGAHLKPSMLVAQDPRTAARLLYRQRATAFASEGERRRLFNPDFLRACGYDPSFALLGHFRAAEPPWRGCHRFDLVDRQRRFIACGPLLLRQIVDVETPFYGGDLARTLSRAPVRTLFEQRGYLLMHRRLLPRLAAVPDATRHIPVAWPFPIRLGKKALDFGTRKLRPRSAGGAPIPYADWFRGPLRTFVTDRLLDGIEAVSGVLDRAAVAEIVREHLEGRTDHTTRIGCLLSLVTWLHLAREPSV